MEMEGENEAKDGEFSYTTQKPMKSSQLALIAMFIIYLKPFRGKGIQVSGGELSSQVWGPGSIPSTVETNQNKHRKNHMGTVLSGW